MAKIHHALYKGVSIRYVSLKGRVWFFLGDVAKVTPVDDDTLAKIDPRHLAGANVKILGTKQRVDIVTAFGVLVLGNLSGGPLATSFTHWAYDMARGGAK